MSIHYSSFPRKQKSLHPKALLEVESQKARMRKSGRGREKGKTNTRWCDSKLSQPHSKMPLIAQSLRVSWGHVKLHLSTAPRCLLILSASTGQSALTPHSGRSHYPASPAATGKAGLRGLGTAGAQVQPFLLPHGTTHGGPWPAEQVVAADAAARALWHMAAEL